MILVDTTPLVALCDPRDGLHAKALADVDRGGAATHLRLAPALTESCFLLGHSVHRRRLPTLLVELERTSLTLAPSRTMPTEVAVGCAEMRCDSAAVRNREGLPVVFVDEQVSVT